MQARIVADVSEKVSLSQESFSLVSGQKEKVSKQDINWLPAEDAGLFFQVGEDGGHARSGIEDGRGAACGTIDRQYFTRLYT